MKHSNYFLPNFIRVIYKKVQNELQDCDISLQRFNQYCLAVLLFHLQKWKDKIVDLPFSDVDRQTLERLCSTSDFSDYTPAQEDGKGDRLLEGLAPDAFNYTEVIGKIELLVNYFSQYEVLKEHSEQSSLKGEYEMTCAKLEILRKEFRLPIRLKYNKFKRRDNPFFKGGVEVIIPDDIECRPLPQSELPGDSMDSEAAEDSPEAEEED